MEVRVVGASELNRKLYWYKAKVVKVVDADTVDLLVSLGLHSYSEERFRLYGIDAWEVRGEERRRVSSPRTESVISSMARKSGSRRTRTSKASTVVSWLTFTSRWKTPHL